MGRRGNRILGLCQQHGCTRQAVGQAAAQWTVFDYVSYDLCPVHILPGLKNLTDLRVDGELPFDAWILWYDGHGDFVQGYKRS